MGLQIFFGIYLPHLHNSVSYMITNKMVSNRHVFIDQGDTRVSHVQHHNNVVQIYGCRFRDIDPHLSKVILENNRLLGSLLQNCEISTKCLVLHRGMSFL